MPALLTAGGVKGALLAGVEARDATGGEDPFFVCDLGHVRSQLRQWEEYLPQVTPHYAVKCNNDKRILKQLASLGTGFDCASEGELRSIISLGVDPSRIIYAHPCKNRRGLRFAREHGVRHMTFDNSDELLKIKQEYPEAQLILRIFADDPDALSRLSAKYGVSLDDSKHLLSLAAKLDLDVCGVSFHVGSGAKNAVAYREALQSARSAFDQATALGFRMHLLDIGGGFSQKSFTSFAPTVQSALAEYFPSDQVRVIAEPGRYFVEGSMVLACNVTARRRPSQETSETDAATMLYLNDGCYGTFGNCVWEDFVPEPRVLRSRVSCEQHYASADDKRRRYILWGPTCDAMDKIRSDCFMDQEISVDDWLYFENMGAYTTATATSFNGYTSVRDVLYIDSGRAPKRPRKGRAT